MTSKPFADGTDEPVDPDERMPSVAVRAAVVVVPVNVGDAPKNVRKPDRDSLFVLPVASSVVSLTSTDTSRSASAGDVFSLYVPNLAIRLLLPAQSG